MPRKVKKIKRMKRSTLKPKKKVASKGKVRRKVYLTFAKDKTREAIICDMYDRYKVRFNIRSASVDDHMGLIAVEMIADSNEQMIKAFKYFERRGVKVEPIEISVFE